mmetsp:Transcript_21356/g.52627  ORF Transcript_21356/g.52627 Transcript_21356/m.52627 type:complete len:363 (-) Transcript_21356:74-1162(-)
MPDLSGESLDLDAVSGLELGPQLGELGVGLGVVSEEGLLILGVLLGEGLELLVLEDLLVGGELEELLVGVLIGHDVVVAVVELEPLLGPRGAAGLADAGLAVGACHGRAISELGLLSPETRAVLPGAAEGVRAGERHDVLVVEPHAEEDLAEVAAGGGVLGGLGAAGAAVLAVLGGLSVGEVALGGAVLRTLGVHAAVLHVDGGATSLLDSDGRGHLVEIGVADEGELGLDGLEHLNGGGQAVVGAVLDLGLEADGADGAAGLGPGLLGKVRVERARVVPREAHHQGVGVGLVDQRHELRLALLELLHVLSIAGRHREDEGRTGRTRRGGAAAEPDRRRRAGGVAAKGRGGRVEGAGASHDA